MNKKVSIVMPVFCEEDILAKVFDRLQQVFPPANDGPCFEFLFVDDGSTDRSLELLGEFARRERRATVLALSRNFGHQSALLAGIHEATGDAVVLMDADLQDPPELVHRMVEEWMCGADVVYAQRRERRGEGFFKRVTASIFYRLLEYLSDTSLPRNVGDFRLMDRIVVDHLKNLGERSLYLRGMSAWLGFSQAAVIFDRDPRTAGETKYSPGRMIALATDAILSFSEKPLRLVTRIGLVVMFLSFVWVTYLLVDVAFADGRAISGWPSMIVTVLFLGGVQLLSLGVVGEYVSRTYRETKGRPLYIIDHRKRIPR